MKTSRADVWLFLLITCLLLSACGAAKPGLTDNPNSPRAADAKLTRGAVQIDRATLGDSGTSGDALLRVAGNLPTPCHQLRLHIPEKPDADGVLRIEAWSVYDPGQMCAQMLQPFSVEVRLPRAGLKKVLMNGNEISG